MFTYVLWYCILSVLVVLSFRPPFIHALPRLLFPFLLSLTSFRLPFTSSSFYLGKLVLAVDIVHRLLTFLRLRTYCKRKGQQRRFVYILFNREGTDLGTNVFVSLIPDGQSDYKYD